MESAPQPEQRLPEQSRVMSSSPLRPGEVIVRFVRCEPFRYSNLARHARDLLGSDERSRAARLRSSHERRDYLGAHALMRTTLAEVTGLEPRQIQIGRTRKGKPEILWPPSGSRL